MHVLDELVMLRGRMKDIRAQFWSWRGVTRARRAYIVTVGRGDNLHVAAGVVMEGSKTVTKSSNHLVWKAVGISIGYGVGVDRGVGGADCFWEVRRCLGAEGVRGRVYVCC